MKWYTFSNFDKKLKHKFIIHEVRLKCKIYFALLEDFLELEKVYIFKLYVLEQSRRTERGQAFAPAVSLMT